MFFLNKIAKLIHDAGGGIDQKILQGEKPSRKRGPGEFNTYPSFA